MLPAGYFLDLCWVWLPNTSPFCENYTKLYFDAKHLERDWIDAVTTSFFISCFASVFISADIIFYKFLELHSILSEENFLNKFSFFNEFTERPHPGFSLLRGRGESPLYQVKIWSFPHQENSPLSRPPPLTNFSSLSTKG